MRIVIQRVLNASVTVDGKTVGSIDRGFLIFLGLFEDDEEKDLPVAVQKISKLRIFEDENGKTNLSIKDVGGSALIVSQFTLCADTSHGNRPSFTNAMKPDRAKYLYEKFISLLSEEIQHVECGIFGADMKVSLLNDGPFTIVL